MSITQFRVTQGVIQTITRACGCVGDLLYQPGQAGAGGTQVCVCPGGGEGDEARLVAGDPGVDPALVLRDACIHSWELGQGAADTEAHDTRLDPHRTLLTHHRTARIALRDGSEQTGVTIS